MEEEKIGSMFMKLAKIDVKALVEEKDGLGYLSWPFAVAKLREADPTATWEVRRFQGKDGNSLPYLKTELGYFVEVAVTCAGVTLSQIHPVLDKSHQVITAPTAFDINTSIQRALVKGIALHGLGLSVYAGEDLPFGEIEGEKPKPGGTGDLVSQEQVETIRAGLAEVHKTEEELLAWLKTKATKLEELTVAEYERAMKAMACGGKAAA